LQNYLQLLHNRVEHHFVVRVLAECLRIITKIVSANRLKRLRIDIFSLIMNFNELVIQNYFINVVASSGAGAFSLTLKFQLAARNMET